MRSPEPADAPAAAELMNAQHVDEIGMPHTDVSEVSRDWSLPGHDLAKDHRLIFDGDELVGSLWMYALEPFERIHMNGYVHPGHKGRGVGSLILDLGEARAVELADAAPAPSQVVLLQAVWAGSEGTSFLRRHGFEPIRTFNYMEIDLEGILANPELPAGISVREMIPGRDEHAVWEASTEAFRDHYGSVDHPFDEWRHWMIDGNPHFDPSLWFLAVDGEDLAGMSLCIAGTPADANVGFVDDLSVRKPWRRRGIATALLQHSFKEFRARGLPRGALEVDSENLTGATHIYERAGMHVARSAVQFQKELRPAT